MAVGDAAASGEAMLEAAPGSSVAPACCAATGPCRSPAWTPSWGKKPSAAEPASYEDTYAPAAGPQHGGARGAAAVTLPAGRGLGEREVLRPASVRKQEGARPARRVTSPEGGASTRSFVALEVLAAAAVR